MSAEDGQFLKLNRSILNWEWYGDIPVRVLFIHLLLNCRYKPGKWQGLDMVPGQLPTSLPALATGTCLSLQQVRTALKKLESTGEITDDSTNSFRLITVKNWAKWQGQSTGRSTGQQQTINRPATDDQQASNSTLRRKESKNGKMEEELPLTGGGEPPKGFGDPIINELMEHLKALNGGKLDGTIKANRFACSNLVNEAKKKIPEPTASLRAFLTECKALDHHGPLCTSFDYIQRNQVKLTNLIRQKRENSTTNGKATSAQRGQPTITERMERGRLALAGLGYSGGAGDADPGHYDPHEVVG